MTIVGNVAAGIVPHGAFLAWPKRHLGSGEVLHRALKLVDFGAQCGESLASERLGQLSFKFGKDPRAGTHLRPAPLGETHPRGASVVRIRSSFDVSAVHGRDIEALEGLLDRHRVAYLVSGVRQDLQEAGRLPGNWVHIGVSTRLEKGGPAPTLTGQPWFHVRQDKHHRWSLDEAQINQYHLGGALHPHVRWWEATDVPRRAVSFIEVHELTIAVLVCEDLAQSDAVSEVIRSVGPTLLLTPLLDGPPLVSRWSARYKASLGMTPDLRY